MDQIKKNIKKNKEQVLRFIIQVVFFLTIPSAYTAAFNGVKSIITAMGAGERVELTSFVMALIGISLFTLVFGRFFCGFACAFGSVSDWIYNLTSYLIKKTGGRRKTIPQSVMKYLSHLKYIVLAVSLVLCYTGVYAQLKGISPWDVFSMVTAGNMRLAGYGVGIVLLLLIVCGITYQERFFCRCLCPMGAVFSLLPVLPVFALRRDRESCIGGCSACSRKCPMDIQLPPAEKSSDHDGALELAEEAESEWTLDHDRDCIQCQKCISTCPKSNVHSGMGGLRGNELWWTLVRAVALLAVLKVLGL